MSQFLEKFDKNKYYVFAIDATDMLQAWKYDDLIKAMEKLKELEDKIVRHSTTSNILTPVCIWDPEFNLIVELSALIPETQATSLINQLANEYKIE
jgi:hypothetical protein